MADDECCSESVTVGKPGSTITESGLLISCDAYPGELLNVKLKLELKAIPQPTLKANAESRDRIEPSGEGVSVALEGEDGESVELG